MLFPVIELECSLVVFIRHTCHMVNSVQRQRSSQLVFFRFFPDKGVAQFTSVDIPPAGVAELL